VTTPPPVNLAKRLVLLALGYTFILCQLVLESQLLWVRDKLLNLFRSR